MKKTDASEDSRGIPSVGGRRTHSRHAAGSNNCVLELRRPSKVTCFFDRLPPWLRRGPSGRRPFRDSFDRGRNFSIRGLFARLFEIGWSAPCRHQPPWRRPGRSPRFPRNPASSIGPFPAQRTCWLAWIALSLVSPATQAASRCPQFAIAITSCPPRRRLPRACWRAFRQDQANLPQELPCAMLRAIWLPGCV